jgi:hypothetical protein
MKDDYEKLKKQNEVQVKKYFAHQLQYFCSFVDQIKSVTEVYFSHNSVPVSMIRAMEDYYATLRVMLSEFPEVAMDQKLQGAIGKIFMPYQKVLGKMSTLADQYVMQQKAKKG